MRRVIQDRQPSKDAVPAPKQPASLTSTAKTKELEDRITQKDIALTNVKEELAATLAKSQEDRDNADRKAEAQDAELDNLTTDVAKLSEKLEFAEAAMEAKGEALPIPRSVKLASVEEAVTGNNDCFNVTVKAEDGSDLTLIMTWELSRKMFQKVKQLYKNLESSDA